MLYYAKIIGAGLFVAALLILGWTVKGWAADSSLLVDARAALRDQQKRAISIQAEKNEIQKELIRTAAELADMRLKTRNSQINSGVAAVQKSIHENVKPDPQCDVGEPVAGMLQRARAGNLPEPASVSPKP